EDARFKYLDEETPDHSGTSPFNVKVTAVGDELIYANGKSKVITIAGKDRSAIGLAGQYGTAYMHSATTGRFITSNYYMEDYPDCGSASMSRSRRTSISKRLGRCCCRRRP